MHHDGPKRALSWKRRIQAKESLKGIGSPLLGGYDRIVGALVNLGHQLSDQTVGNILRPAWNSTRPQAQPDDHLEGVHPPAHGRAVRSRLLHGRSAHLEGSGDVLRAVFHSPGQPASHHRRITAHPDQSWMQQIARNATLEHLGYLNPCRYVLHHRDKKFCASFRDTLATANVKCLALSRRSPNLNAFAER